MSPKTDPSIYKSLLERDSVADQGERTGFQVNGAEITGYSLRKK